jgi:hypothetical protein
MNKSEYYPTTVVVQFLDGNIELFTIEKSASLEARGTAQLYFTNISPINISTIYFDH